MDSKRYLRVLLFRFTVIFVAMLLLSYLLVMPGYHGASVLSLLFVVVLTFELVRQSRKTNREIARFFDAVKGRAG